MMERKQKELQAQDKRTENTDDTPKEHAAAQTGIEADNGQEPQKGSNFYTFEPKAVKYTIKDGMICEIPPDKSGSLVISSMRGEVIHTIPTSSIMSIKKKMFGNIEIKYKEKVDVVQKMTQIDEEIAKIDETPIKDKKTQSKREARKKNLLREKKEMEENSDGYFGPARKHSIPCEKSNINKIYRRINSLLHPHYRYIQSSPTNAVIAVDGAVVGVTPYIGAIPCTDSYADTGKRNIILYNEDCMPMRLGKKKITALKSGADTLINSAREIVAKNPSNDYTGYSIGSGWLCYVDEKQLEIKSPGFNVVLMIPIANIKKIKKIKKKFLFSVGIRIWFTHKKFKKPLTYDIMLEGMKHERKLRFGLLYDAIRGAFAGQIVNAPASDDGGALLQSGENKYNYGEYKITVDDINNHFIKWGDGYRFENVISNLFKAKGYNIVQGYDIDAEKGGMYSKPEMQKGDFGLDVLAAKGSERICIQSKVYHDKAVGSEVIIKTIGAGLQQQYNCNKAIVITTSRFTVDAKKAAENSSMPVELWDFDRTVKEIRQYLL